jgi:hypothetical protein
MFPLLAYFHVSPVLRSTVSVAIEEKHANFHYWRGELDLKGATSRQEYYLQMIFCSHRHGPRLIPNDWHYFLPIFVFAGYYL